MKNFSLSENSTLTGGGLTVVGISLITTGIDIVKEKEVTGIVLVLCGVIAALIGSYAAYRPETKTHKDDTNG